MNLPSVKSIMQIKDVDLATARKVREVLECKSYDRLEVLSPAAQRYIRACYNRPALQVVKLTAIDELIGTCGLEYIEHGSNAKSPSIEYLNAGDTYATTLMWVNGSYRVGCLGDIVERGNYA